MLQPMYRGQKMAFCEVVLSFQHLHPRDQLKPSRLSADSPLSHLTDLALFLGDKGSPGSPGCEADSPASASCWNYRLCHIGQNNELGLNLDCNTANLILVRYLAVSSSSSKNETLIVFRGLPQSFSIMMKTTSHSWTQPRLPVMIFFSHSNKFVK